MHFVSLRDATWYAIRTLHFVLINFALTRNRLKQYLYLNPCISKEYDTAQTDTFNLCSGLENIFNLYIQTRTMWSLIIHLLMILIQLY